MSEEMVLVSKRDLDDLLEACMEVGWVPDARALDPGSERSTLKAAAAIIRDSFLTLQEMHNEASQIGDRLEDIVQKMESQGDTIGDVISLLSRSIEAAEESGEAVQDVLGGPTKCLLCGSVLDGAPIPVAEAASPSVSPDGEMPEFCGLPVAAVGREIPLDGDWISVTVSTTCLLPPKHDGECKDAMVVFAEEK